MFRLSEYSQHVAVISDCGESLTYAELEDIANVFEKALPTKGLVFTLCENVLGSFTGYVACMVKGIPQVLLDCNKDWESLQQLISVYHPEYVWSPDALIEKIGGSTLYQHHGYSLQALRLGDSTAGTELNDDLLLCLTTSGSTGSPKFVRLSKKNLLSNAKSITEYLGITEGDRPVTSLPMYYSYGMSVINSHLIKGATILLTDKAVLQREFWDFVKTQGATSLAGVPYTYEMLKRLRFFRMDLPALKTLMQAGGKLNSAYVKEYVEFAAKNDKRFIVMYGQTEASPRMSYLPVDKAVEKCASIGIAIPGGQLSVVDEAGNTITNPEEDGELLYMGENVCLGYAECRADLSKGDENRGVLRTGDIAHFDAEGFFYITGRMKRFVKIWGNRTNLDAIEQLVKELTPHCACCGIDDLITIFVTEPEQGNRIKTHLVEKTGFNPRAFAIRFMDSLPVKSNGKIDYPALQKLL